MKNDRWASSLASRIGGMGIGGLGRALGAGIVASGLLSCQASSLGLTAHTASTYVVPPSSPPAKDAVLLPTDPAVSTGVFDNGLSYLVRRRASRDRRVHLVLAVKAGSVLEEDDGRSVAHFLQHMAFQGTENFSQAQLSEFFAKAGMSLNPDDNASTLYDSTVYQFSVPAGDPQLLEQALDILRDFAHGLSIEPARVDAQRTTLLTEVRDHLSQVDSIDAQRMRMILRGSRYTDRAVRAMPTAIVAASTAQIREFHRRWYRPELLAVVMVGDFEVDEATQKIATRFAALPSPEIVEPRPRYSVPRKAGSHVARLASAEQGEHSAQISLKLPPSGFQTESDYRLRLKRQLLVQMLSQRLRIAAKDPASAFSSAAVALQPSFLDAFDLVQIQGSVQEGQQYNALHALLVELRRAAVHGFVDTEVERVKMEVLRRLDADVLVEPEIGGKQLALELAQSFLTGHKVPGPDLERAVGARLLSEVTAQQLHEEFKQWTSQAERYVVAAGTEVTSLPEEIQLLGAINEVNRMEVKPYRDLAADGQLMVALPEPGTIVQEKFLPAIGVHEWTLSNGARVVFKPSSTEPGRVVEQSISAGGTSTVGDRHFASARYAQQVVNVGGLGDYDVAQLGKLLTGKDLLVSPWIDEHQEGIRASAATKDLETMMQLMYLFAKSPRRDEVGFNALRRQLFENLAAREVDPPRVLVDTIERRSWQPAVRHSPATPESIQDINLDVAMKFYTQRFGNVSDFTFAFVGDVEVERMKELSKRYLASLPGSDRDDTYVDRKERRRPGVLRIKVRGGDGPDSRVSVTYHGEQPWSAEAELELQALRGYLEARLREELSRAAGRSVPVQVWTRMERRPFHHYALGFQFECEPSKVAELKEVASDAIADVRKRGVGLAFIERLKAQAAVQYERALSSNLFWAEQLASSYEYGDDPMAIAQLTDRLQALTADRVRTAAVRYLRPDQFVDAVLVPDPVAPKAPANSKAPATEPSPGSQGQPAASNPSSP